jgi:hypothetical protein
MRPSRLSPLVLLIPAVVLAQPAPQAQAPAAQSQQATNINFKQNVLPNSADLNKAAVASQALSKARSKQSADNLGREDTTAGGGYYITTKDGSRFYCSSADAKECYNTNTDYR